MAQPLTILYFAWLREQTGLRSETFVLPSGVTTVAELMACLAARGAGFETAFQRRSAIRCAINQEFASPADPVREGDEVAFFPPVTGG